MAAAGAETAAAVETGGALTALGEGALAVAGAAGAATGGLVAAGAAAAGVVGTAWAIEGGLGWGAETGGGTDSDASRPSRAKDVQTLNGMQDSGAVEEQRQSSVCCVVYASQPKLRVQSSLASWMLRGFVACKFRI